MKKCFVSDAIDPCTWHRMMPPSVGSDTAKPAHSEVQDAAPVMVGRDAFLHRQAQAWRDATPSPNVDSNIEA